MRHAVLTSIALFIAAAGSVHANDPEPFAPNVDTQTGAIRVPASYVEWPTLGTWAHAHTGPMLEEKGPGSHEHHVVYTQAASLKHYRATGEFPDGAVLVKELLHAETIAMTTGLSVGHATTIKGWFVMVRDKEGRFGDSALWGDGWGWSFFEAPDSEHTVSTNYKADCIGCHLPARQLAPEGAVEEDKWIYTLGYPVLRPERLDRRSN